MARNNSTRGGHLTPVQRNARVRAANRIKELLAIHKIEHRDAERLFGVSNWMMSKIRVNPEAVAVTRLLEIENLIKKHVDGENSPTAAVPDEPIPLSEDDFEPAPKPEPKPMSFRSVLDPVKLLSEAIEAYRRSAMMPLELLEYANSSNRILTEMRKRLNSH